METRSWAPFLQVVDNVSLETGDARDDRAVITAAGLFLRSGIANVKMTDIARESRMGVATLYRHFSTKSRIAIAAGTLMWRRLNGSVKDVVESDDFLVLNGISRLEALLQVYIEMYVAHPNFVRFLDEFDHMVLSEKIPEGDLEDYGREVDSFYTVFDDAYLLGRQDGSIKRAVEFNSYYYATAHALMGVAQKLVRGEVIPSDDFSSGERELRCIADMAVRSLTVAN